MNTSRRCRRAVLLAVVMMTTNGCSLVGLGVGRAVVHYEPGAPVSGDQGRVRALPDAGKYSAWVYGRYEEHDGSGPRLVSEDGRQRISLADEGSARDVEVAKGSEWRTGLLVGIILDTVLLGALAAYVVTADFSPTNNLGGGLVPIMR